MKPPRKRTNEIKIRFTDEEVETLNAKVSKAGMSREKYCRQVLSGTQVTEGPTADVPVLLREVRQISVSLDQLMKPGISLCGGRERERMERLLHDLQEVEELIVEAYSTRG